MLCERRPELSRCLLVPVLICLEIGLGVAGMGCGNRGNPTPKPLAVDANDDSLAAALHRLEKDADAGTCREVLQTIDSGIPLSEPRSDPSPQDLQKIAALARLNPNEMDALAAREFSSVDPDYLAECLLLRDALRSLELEGYPPEVRAAQAFAWVCRQVYLIDEVLPAPAWMADQAPPRWVFPAPVWWVLEEGSGCAIDRAAIFLGLLQQMEMDGCLIGPPQLADARSFRAPSNKNPSPAYAPVRAVGVRIDKEILLFDPSLGKPIPGPDGKGIATYAQLRARPESSGDWLTSSGLKADEVKTWEVFLSAPLSGLAPRMDWLQRQMPAANKVILATNLLKRISAFDSEALASESLRGVKCRFWNAPDDALSPTRILASYDREVRGEGGMLSPLKTGFRQSRFPSAYVPPPNSGGIVLEGGPFELIRGVFSQEFAPVFLASGSPRDLLLRGQFNNALAALEELDRVNTGYRTRIARESNLEAALKEWSEKASPIFAALITAERTGDPGALAKARTDQANFLKSPSSERMVMLVRRNTSLLLCAEAKYLVALIVHERAERIQARFAQSPMNDAMRNEAARTWDNAADNWKVFLNNYPELSDYYKYRFKHARQLQARCLEFLAAAKHQ